jgi:SAM-dependent methyltransferase
VAIPRGHAGWDEYWSADRQASCVPENPELARTIAAFWIAQFAACGPEARILDVGTGNGIVLAYAAEAARRRGHRFSLTGVDLAAIDPARFVPGLAAQLSAATFRGGVAAEQLPFADGSFDLVCSQYGLEYADLPRALAEAGRVLAPGGRLLWLGHHVVSDVVVQNTAHRAQLDYLLADGGAWAAMRAFVGALGHVDRRESAVRRLGDALAAAEAWCREHPPARIVASVCGEFADVARRADAWRPEDLHRMLEDGERRMRLHRLRIEDLAAAVLTPERLATVRSALSGPGWRDLRVEEIRMGPLSSGVGFLIQATRTSGAPPDLTLPDPTTATS